MKEHTEVGTAQHRHRQLNRGDAPVGVHRPAIMQVSTCSGRADEAAVLQGATPVDRLESIPPRHDSRVVKGTA